MRKFVICLVAALIALAILGVVSGESGASVDGYATYYVSVENDVYAEEYYATPSYTTMVNMAVAADNVCTGELQEDFSCKIRR